MVPIGISTLNGTTYVEPAMELMPCWQVCVLVLPGGWWDPLRYVDPVAVLCGNVGVSCLSGLCVLGVYTLVLFLLNGLLIRKHA